MILSAWLCPPLDHPVEALPWAFDAQESVVLPALEACRVRQCCGEHPTPSRRVELGDLSVCGMDRDELLALAQTAYQLGGRVGFLELVLHTGKTYPCPTCQIVVGERDEVLVAEHGRRRRAHQAGHGWNCNTCHGHMAVNPQSALRMVGLGVDRHPGTSEERTREGLERLSRAKGGTPGELHSLDGRSGGVSWADQPYSNMTMNVDWAALEMKVAGMMTGSGRAAGALDDAVDASALAVRAAFRADAAKLTTRPRGAQHKGSSRVPPRTYRKGVR